MWFLKIDDLFSDVICDRTALIASKWCLQPAGLFGRSALLYSYFMPVCRIVKTITPRCRGRPDALLHEAAALCALPDHGYF